HLGSIPYAQRLVIGDVLFGVPTFQASIRPPPGGATLKANGVTVRLFGGRLRTVPYLATARVDGVPLEARVLALFPDDQELRVLEAQPLSLPGGHVPGALAYVHFYLRGKTLVIGAIQSDVYRALRQEGTTKSRYRDWQKEMRLGLEAYARGVGVEQIVSPTSEQIQQRWPPDVQSDVESPGIARALADIVYDQDMPGLGYHQEDLPEPMAWEGGLTLTRAWVKRLDPLVHDPLLAQFQQVLKEEAQGSAAISPSRNLEPTPREIATEGLDGISVNEPPNPDAAKVPSEESPAVKQTAQVTAILDQANAEQPYQPKDKHLLDLPPASLDSAIRHTRVNVVDLIDEAIREVWPAIKRQLVKTPEDFQPDRIIIEIGGSVAYLRDREGKIYWPGIGHVNGEPELDIVLYLPDEWSDDFFSEFGVIDLNRRQRSQTLTSAIAKKFELVGVHLHVDVCLRPMPVRKLLYPLFPEFPYHPDKWYFATPKALAALQAAVSANASEHRHMVLQKYFQLFTEAKEFPDFADPSFTVKAVRRLVQLAQMRGDYEEAQQLFDLIVKVVDHKVTAEDLRNPLKQSLTRADPAFNESDIEFLVERYETQRRLGPAAPGNMGNGGARVNRTERSDRAHRRGGHRNVIGDEELELEAPWNAYDYASGGTLVPDSERRRLAVIDDWKLLDQLQQRIKTLKDRSERALKPGEVNQDEAGKLRAEIEQLGAEVNGLPQELQGQAVEGDAAPKESAKIPPPPITPAPPPAPPEPPRSSQPAEPTPQAATRPGDSPPLKVGIDPTVATGDSKAQQQRKAEAHKQFQQGEGHEQAGRLEEALRLNRYEEVEESAREALVLAPDPSMIRAELLYKLADALVELGRPDEGLRLFDETIEALEALAKRTKRPAELREIQRFAAIVGITKAQTYYSLDRHNEARASIQELRRYSAILAERQPSVLAYALMLQGHLAYAEGDLQGARRLYERAHGADPHPTIDDALDVVKGRVAEQANNVEEAITRFRRVLAHGCSFLGPTLPLRDTESDVPILVAALKQAGKARVRELEKRGVSVVRGRQLLIAYHPPLGEALRALGRVYAKQPEPERQLLAFLVLEAVMRLKEVAGPSSSTIQQLFEAIRSRINPETASNRLLAAEASLRAFHLEQAGQIEAARQEYARALDVNAEDIVSRFAAGRVAYLRGRYDEAVQWLTTARDTAKRMRPGDRRLLMDISRVLGVSLLELDRPRALESLEALTEALTLLQSIRTEPLDWAAYTAFLNDPPVQEKYLLTQMAAAQLQHALDTEEPQAYEKVLELGRRARSVYGVEDRQRKEGMDRAVLRSEALALWGLKRYEPATNKMEDVVRKIEAELRAANEGLKRLAREAGSAANAPHEAELTRRRRELEQAQARALVTRGSIRLFSGQSGQLELGVSDLAQDQTKGWFTPAGTVAIKRYLAEALLRLGDLDGARREIGEALSLAQSIRPVVG
ncbi:MAG: tetratricopeptide repeat protein, partial [Candidatus Omnitrophica bacterium]|nr:tetratricopeptide repeat protein [Candidatus Omnitrophota bacterium]